MAGGFFVLPLAIPPISTSYSPYYVSLFLFLATDMKPLACYALGALLSLAACTGHKSATAETEAEDFSGPYNEMYRPQIHFSPAEHWMNDPNGLVYYDGEYHLFYQYYPEKSVWGPMHWGHAVSRDLMHWEHLPIALAPDSLGYIFSGSAVVDWENTSGLGTKENPPLLAFFTYHNPDAEQAKKTEVESQALAYSTDRGRTWTKYAGNPILPNPGDARDFRDPKVFWHKASSRWIVSLACGDEIRFYASPDCKSWTYLSSFGRDRGGHGGVWECPDLFQLPVAGTDETKWVLIVNINPGCLFGGSATEYFVGEFDGKEFKCDTPPSKVKWLDFGKDHYATVTFSNTGQRVIALPWMSNWQYANVTPIQQYRGANGLPRELSLYRHDGDFYVAADVAPEVRALRKTAIPLGEFTIAKKHDLRDVLAPTKDAFELEFDITPGKSAKSGFTLYNAKGEKVDIYIDARNNRLVMDRTKSGLVAFGERSQPHEIETNYDVHEHRGKGETFRKRNSVNYVNDFALGTWAPLNLCEGKTYHLDVFVDKCSVEIFVDGGRIAMTNLVFPTAPYISVQFYSQKGAAKVSNARIYPLQPTVDTTVQ